MYSLSYAGDFHFEISHNIKKYTTVLKIFISSLSIVPCPPFPMLSALYILSPPMYWKGVEMGECAVNGE